MPLFEYRCDACGQQSEIIVMGGQEQPIVCEVCQSEKMIKLVSAHSSSSGQPGKSIPGLGDTGCCGSSPDQAQGCAGPGSCCGKDLS